tara:strand:+ start:170 stop:1099 length:930 start_codon:yes stop_codon:yes gene_type:complete
MAASLRKLDAHERNEEEGQYLDLDAEKHPKQLALEEAEIVDADAFMKFNALWWKNSPNETRQRMTKGGLLNFPTNYMTAYTLQEVEDLEDLEDLEDVGDDRIIVELNQHCISLEGQSSTVKGVDTSLTRGSGVDASLTLQRGYLVFLLPKGKAMQFFGSFNQTCNNCMMAIEFVGDKEIEFERNIQWKEELEKDTTTGRRHIWVTCTVEADGNVSFPTKSPNEPGQIDQSSSDLNKEMFQFNNYIFCEREEFACITIITNEVGLDDETVHDTVQPLRTAPTLPDFVTLASSNRNVSLPKQVTTHIQSLH